jgi:hypothetical protein
VFVGDTPAPSLGHSARGSTESDIAMGRTVPALDTRAGRNEVVVRNNWSGPVPVGQGWAVELVSLQLLHSGLT